MNLEVLENKLKVIKLSNNIRIPDILFNQEWYSITKTNEELSIVVDESFEIQSNIVEYNWKAIKVVGTLDFSLIGILSKISTILAQAEISIFALSTYNTDYILLKSDKLEKAIKVLKESGYTFI
ncbi:MAG: ACT domain-containing protein [Clostridia bacterium]